MRALAVLLALGLAGCQSAPQNGPQSAIPNEVGIGTRSTFAIATPAGPARPHPPGKINGGQPALPLSAPPRAALPPPRGPGLPPRPPTAQRPRLRVPHA